MVQPEPEVNPDSMRSMLLFFAALVALGTAVLNLLNTRLQAAKTEDDRQAIYFSVLRWIELGLWIAGMVASMLFGLGSALFFFLAGYILGCVSFVRSRSPYLRPEILQLVVGTGSMVFFASMYWIQRLSTEMVRLIDTVAELVNALAGK